MCVEIPCLSFPNPSPFFQPIFFNIFSAKEETGAEAVSFNFPPILSLSFLPPSFTYAMTNNKRIILISCFSISLMHFLLALFSIFVVIDGFNHPVPFSRRKFAHSMKIDVQAPNQVAKMTNSHSTTLLRASQSTSGRAFKHNIAGILLIGSLVGGSNVVGAFESPAFGSMSSTQFVDVPGVARVLDSSSAPPGVISLHTSHTTIGDSSVLTADSLSAKPKPTAEEIKRKKDNFNFWFWGGGFVAPFLATFYYFGFKFWEK
mmetsp:Transcript_23310/g.48493  ORF Transcript_23310/g.48493 Transcript_23310/m.48493 type:complete len:260 (-) Transcript_23310:121-900(-)